MLFCLGSSWSYHSKRRCVAQYLGFLFCILYTVMVFWSFHFFSFALSVISTYEIEFLMKIIVDARLIVRLLF